MPVLNYSNFLSFFVDKISRDIRASIIPSSTPFFAYPTRQFIWDCFSSNSLQDLIDLVGSMKPSSSPVNILATSMLKNVLGSIGPCLVFIK